MGSPLLFFVAIGTLVDPSQLGGRRRVIACCWRSLGGRSRRRVGAADGEARLRPCSGGLDSVQIGEFSLVLRQMAGRGRDDRRRHLLFTASHRRRGTRIAASSDPRPVSCRPKTANDRAAGTAVIGWLRIVRPFAAGEYAVFMPARMTYVMGRRASVGGARVISHRALTRAPVRAAGRPRQQDAGTSPSAGSSLGVAGSRATDGSGGCDAVEAYRSTAIKRTAWTLGSWLE